MKVTKHSKLKAWPKRWEASEPTAESFGLYFFSDNMRCVTYPKRNFLFCIFNYMLVKDSLNVLVVCRPNKELDRLVQYVTDHSIVLKYGFGFARLLIFPSVLLPEQCQSKYHIADFIM
jgi:hypothetical protein